MPHSSSTGSFFIYPINAVIAVIAWAAAYVSVPVEYISILVLMMVFDVAFGVCKAFSLGDDVTSRRLISGILGKTAALIMVFVLALMAKGVVVAAGGSFDFTHLISAILIFILIGEGHSVVRNFVATFYKVDIPEWSAWVYLGRMTVKIAEFLLNKTPK